MANDIHDVIPAVVGTDIAHLHQYRAPWAMLPASFQTALEMIKTRELLAAHVGGSAKADRHDVQAAGGPQTGVMRGGPHKYFVLADGTGVVEMRGAMTKYGSSMSDLPAGTLGVRHALRQMSRDKDVEAVLFVIDSPGGSVLGTDDLAEDVRELAKVKPLVAYIEDLGASAGYWVASQATRVLASRQAFVGSIGTYMVIEDWSGFYQENGIKAHLISSGGHKGAGVQGTEVTDEHLAEFQRTVDLVTDNFVSAIASGRKMAKGDVRKLADGRVHVAGDAKKLGLIDGIASIDGAFSALDTLRKEKTGMSNSTNTDIQAAAGGSDSVNQNQAAALVAAEAPVAEAAAEAKPETKPEPAAEAAPAAAAPVADGKQFIEAFGTQGAVWFAEGKTFAEARDLHMAALKKDNEELKSKLEQYLDRGEEKPVSSADAPLAVDDRTVKLQRNLGEGLGRFAAAIKLPTGKR